MEDATIVKAARVALYALNRPKFLVPYLRSQFSAPVKWALPAYSFAAIDFLLEFIQPHHCVFEFGSGGATLFLAQKAQNVVAVEPDTEKYQELVGIINQEGITKVDLRYVALESEMQSVQFSRSAFLDALGGGYDIVVIGSLPSGFGEYERAECFRRAEDSMQDGGAIIVENSWNSDRLRQIHNARNYTTFKGLGPFRWSTAATGSCPR